MHLRRNQIEAWAMQAVQAVLAGGRVEDERVECKADWPDEDKARQLAGHANAARGEPILWQIGVDEKGHQLAQPSPVDPADWWPRIAKRFDQVAPELLVVTVHLDHGRTVTALAFTTDQAPYVVTTGSETGRAEREVPFRIGTRTRSTHRHEVLRMLAPVATLPRVLPISAQLSGLAQSDNPVLSLSAKRFFEHVSGGTLLLPTHQMRARLDFDTRGFPAELEPVPMSLNLDLDAVRDDSVSTFGVEPRPDGLLVTGSGVQQIRGWGRIPQGVEGIRLLRRVSTVQARCGFGVAGVDRLLRVSFMLYRPTSMP